MFAESPVFVRRLIRFLLLPYCYVKLVNWRDCSRSKFGVALDFAYIFFVLKDYPEHYGRCRLWEVERAEWARYYGSNYNPHQRQRLRREVHPFHLEMAMRDKEVADGLCRNLGIPVPETLGILEPGETVSDQLSGIFQRTDADRLIIKPVDGHAGMDIALAARQSDQIVLHADNMVVNCGDYRPPTRSLVQKVVVQHPLVSEIAPSSLNTLRLVTMLTKSDDVIIIGACMRFGVGESFVDNWSRGGVAVAVDHARGQLLDTGYDRAGNRFTHHPVSCVEFRGFSLPSWSEAMALGVQVQRAFPFFKILGMDLGFSNEGVILIELNNDAHLMLHEQTAGPLLASRRVWEAFREYDLLYNDKQRQLFMPSGTA